LGYLLSRPYHYVRFRWWSAVDLKAVDEEMRALEFEIKRLEIPKYELELTLQKEYRDELVVKADTLTAHLSQFRAVLTQKEAKPFSRRDMKLRKRIVEIYPQNRPTPLPWDYVAEPKFEVAE
jgi:hypothetical protein